MSTTFVDPETGLPFPLPVLPFGGNPPPMPHIANPLPGVIDQTERKWETIAGAATSVWDKGVSALEGAGSVVWGDIKGAIHSAMNVSQTFWSTYISTLEAWTITGIDELDNAIGHAVAIGYETGTYLEGLIGKTAADALRWVADGIAEAERYADIVRDGLTAVIEGAATGVEAWVLTDVALPLLRDIERAKADVLDVLERGLGDVETYVRDLVDGETLARLGAIAGVVAAVGAITTWVEECGAPMCESFGPNTDLGKALKALEGLLGLLAGVELANLTEADIVKLAGYFSAITEGDVEGFVNAFLGAGETLGSAGGTILSDIGHIAGDAFAEVSGL